MPEEKDAKTLVAEESKHFGLDAIALENEVQRQLMILVAADIAEKLKNKSRHRGAVRPNR
jgi:hypothetical protein